MATHKLWCGADTIVNPDQTCLRSWGYTGFVLTHLTEDPDRLQVRYQDSAGEDEEDLGRPVWYSMFLPYTCAILFILVVIFQSKVFSILFMNEQSELFHKCFMKCKIKSGDFPGGPAIKTLHFHLRGCGFNPRSGNSDPTYRLMRPKLIKVVFTHSLIYLLI